MEADAMNEKQKAIQALNTIQSFCVIKNVGAFEAVKAADKTLRDFIEGRADNTANVVEKLNVCHVCEGDNTVCGSLPNSKHCPKYQEQRDEQIKITKPKLIRNAIQTPDGTVLQSRYRHHQVEYTDKNGKWYMVDGGLSYGRRSANGDEKLLYLYDDEPHEIQRDVIAWGTYGKDGDQPLKYITVAEMETSHIEAVLRDCNPIDVIKNCLVKELEERNAKKPDTPV